MMFDLMGLYERSGRALSVEMSSSVALHGILIALDLVEKDEPLSGEQVIVIANEFILSKRPDLLEIEE